MSKPTLAVVTKSGSVKTCYVDFRDAVSDFGAFDSAPTIVWKSSGTTDNGSAIISAISTTDTGTINGITFTSGQLLTFKVTTDATREREDSVQITYSLGSAACVHTEEWPLKQTAADAD